MSCSCCLCRLQLWGRMAREALDVVLYEGASLLALEGWGPPPPGGPPTGSLEEMMQATAQKLQALDLEKYTAEAAWLTGRIRKLADEDAVYFSSLKETLEQESGHEETFDLPGKKNDLLWLSGTFPVLSHNDFQENNIIQVIKGLGFRVSGSGFSNNTSNSCTSR